MKHLNVRVSQKVKELQDKQLPESEKDLIEILGVPVKYEVDYSSFKVSVTCGGACVCLFQF